MSNEQTVHTPPLHRLRATTPFNSIRLYATLALENKSDLYKCLNIADALEANVEWPIEQRTAREELAAKYILSELDEITDIWGNKERTIFHVKSCENETGIIIQNLDNINTGSRTDLAMRGSADIEHIVKFIKLCAKELNITRMWGFEWSYEANNTVPMIFGGGAVVINLKTGETQYTGTYEMLQEKIKNKELVRIQH